MSKLCGKVIHLSPESVQTQVESLEQRHGKKPNVYICWDCSSAANTKIWHVGYGRSASKLSRKARRNRKMRKSMNNT